MARSESVQKVRPTKTDERLLIEAAQRDRARFADIYEEYFEIVYAYVARRVRNRSTAEDLTSDVFHKALANLPKFKWTGAPFASWLFRIASNLIADRARRKALEADPASSPRVSKGVDTPSLTVGLPPRSGSSSSKTQQSDLEEAERLAVLFRLVETLADDQRRVVALRFAEEKSIKQIAAELGRSEGAVKQLQFRALRNLRKAISPQEKHKS
ncbi:MAG: hypothetical protein DMF73_07005 [Acidobacteria bacterium]|nr:MAG: hypothetical protein DMF73_07005 [Acidobacteriota bacterium]